MSPLVFVKTFFPHAKAVEEETGLSAKLTLAQAALESAWGKAAPGNMFFGVKDSDGINGNEQLLTTTEYHTSMNVKYPVIISVTPVVRNGNKMFKYTIKDYFRKYHTPADCFKDHAVFFTRNPRYAAAWQVRHDPNKFAEKIAAAGYATDPNYAESLKAIIKSIEARMITLGLY